jgi:hypothetical protein
MKRSSVFVLCICFLCPRCMVNKIEMSDLVGTYCPPPKKNPFYSKWLYHDAIYVWDCNSMDSELKLSPDSTYTDSRSCWPFEGGVYSGKWRVSDDSLILYQIKHDPCPLCDSFDVDSSQIDSINVLRIKRKGRLKIIQMTEMEKGVVLQRK